MCEDFYVSMEATPGSRMFIVGFKKTYMMVFDQKMQEKQGLIFIVYSLVDLITPFFCSFVYWMCV
jgi:hypothetical protein